MTAPRAGRRQGPDPSLLVPREEWAEAARWFADLVLRPTLLAYGEAARTAPGGEAASRQIHIGMLVCWKMLFFLAGARGETLSEAFKREALPCFPLHVVRRWALGEERLVYPRWVRPRPRPDEPIELGFCFRSAAEQLLGSVERLGGEPDPERPP